MKLVRFAEDSARAYAIQPTALLFMDLANILSQGSLRTDSSLLSMQANISEWLSATESKAHTELSDALAAPLKIVLITSQDAFQEKNRLYASDFIQNIRHKFLFLLLTRKKAQDRKFRYVPDFSSVRTIFWSDNARSRWTCLRNYDNLFMEKIVGVSFIECKPFISSPCTVNHVHHEIVYRGNKQPVAISVSVICNSTKINTRFELDITGTLRDALRFYLTSRWHLLQLDNTECFSYILITAVDVTTLLKPFEFEVWCLILATGSVIAMVWSKMLRESSAAILYRILQSTITNREIGSSPKSCPLTVISCVALGFSFLIGSIYSNSFMSSFLDPTFVRPPSVNYMYCRFALACARVDLLQYKLGYTPVCHLPKLLISKVDKPLARFRALEDPWPQSYTLEAIWSLNSKYKQLPLVLTQSSIILERLIQHGVISGRVLKIAEHKYILKKQVAPGAGVLIAKSTMETLRTISERNGNLDLPFVTYNTTRKRFDMSSFIKIRSLFSVCLLFIAAAWMFESCSLREQLIHCFEFREGL